MPKPSKLKQSAEARGREIRTLDLFAGAGGLSQGFKDAKLGFEPAFAVEHDPAAAATFKRNFKCEVFDRDIEDGPDYGKPGDYEVIVGGPPCQGFSPLGRDRDDVSRAKLNGLWRHYLDAVRYLQPKAFVIENVPEFQKSSQFAELLKLFESDPVLQGYAKWHGVLNAADYGVPQTRRRGILVAVLDWRGEGRDLPGPPAQTHFQDRAHGPQWRTVKDAFKGLPEDVTGTEPRDLPRGRQDLHFGRTPTEKSKRRFEVIGPGENRFALMEYDKLEGLTGDDALTPACWANKPTGTTDVMGRLWWDRPSVTIRTEFFKPEKGRYLHPSANRVISHREAARIQSFPDSFYFEGTKIQIARQIGNAVPPLLGRAIAEFVYELAFK